MRQTRRCARILRPTSISRASGALVLVLVRSIFKPPVLGLPPVISYVAGRAAIFRPTLPRCAFLENWANRSRARLAAAGMLLEAGRARQHNCNLGHSFENSFFLLV